ncbi:MICAL-like protein isoform X2 [Xylocopa sonorina]
MASCSVPDRLSILTYLSQFYQTFGGSSLAQLPVSRTTDTMEEKITQVSESPKEKEVPCTGVRKDLCAVCGLPIFLAEKLVLSRVAYHRTCFRCARCNNQLTLGNYYETEEGQYCCETCPDEEVPLAPIENWDESRAPSGIEKDDSNLTCKESIISEESISKGVFTHNSAKKINQQAPFISDVTAQTSRLRLNFMSNQLLSEQSEEASLADNPLMNETLGSFERDRVNLKTESINPVLAINQKYNKQRKEEKENDSVDAFLELESSDRKSTSERNEKLVNTRDYLHDELNRRKHTQREKLSVTSFHDSKDKSTTNYVAKELPNQIDEHANAESSSLVQRRRRMFESKTDSVGRNKDDNENIGIIKSKALPEEHEVIGNIKNEIINSDAAKAITNQEEASPTTPDKLSVDSLVQIPSCEISFSDKWKPSQNSTMIVSEKSTNDDQACSNFVNGTNVTSIISSNLCEDYPEDLNPFNSDDAEEITDESMSIMSTSQTTRDVTNYFDNEREMEEETLEKDEIVPPKPAMRNNLNNSKSNEPFAMEGSTKRRLAAPQINLNPFWSDDDDHDSDLESTEKTSDVPVPVPKPRIFKYTDEINTNGQKWDENHDYLHTSNSSLRSPESRIGFGGTYKKKKPAPLPPNKKETGSSDERISLTSKLQCNSTGCYDAPLQATPKTRKAKPPPPPIPTTSNFEHPLISKTNNVNKENSVWEGQKINKDEANRNRQSFMYASSEENFHHKACLDKSIEGKWKRKKGPAPPCPIPHRRKIKVMSLKDVKLELDEIEMQQQGLEKQGVRLEQLIRSKSECDSKANDVCLGADTEELVLELFALVNEKNELFRRQAELMLLRRQQRLEEEHAEIEYQIRCLMSQHESTKTDFDKQKEEALIQRLIDIVEKRNEIVDCLEMDRRREIEEDRSIHRHMDLYAAKNKNESLCNETDAAERKKQKQNKSKEKAKEKKLKKILKKDIDKDIDEIELTMKRRTKRKWF